MDQKKRDCDLMQDIWHLFRDFGDITNGPQDEKRWSDLMKQSEVLIHKYPEARGMFKEVRFMLQERGVTTNQGDLKIAC